MTNGTKIVNILTGIEPPELKISDDTRQYLHQRQEYYTRLIKNNKLFPLGNLFYLIIIIQNSALSMNNSFKVMLEEYLRDIYEGRGFNEFSPKVIDDLESWNSSDITPTGLGTAYGVFLNFMIDEPIDINPNEINEFYSSLKSKEGLYINEEWSDTKLKYRYTPEYWREAFLVLSSLSLLENHYGLPSFDNVDLKTFIKEKGLLESGYLSTEFYKMRMLQLLGEEIDLKSEYIENFLQKHRREVEVGFQDFLLAEKKDELSGSSSRTKRDKVFPQLYATLYGAVIARKYDIDINLEDLIDKTLEESKCDEGGYKFPTYIREYEPEYGDNRTARETFSALLAKSTFA